MALPALFGDDGTTLFQSLAIIEISRRRTPPPLLPADAKDRARVRGLALIVAGEGHPMVVPRVRRYLDSGLNVRESSGRRGGKHWTLETPTSLEGHLAATARPGVSAMAISRRSPTYAWPGMPPWRPCSRSALRPGLPSSASYETAMAMPEFSQAHPLAQPDTPEAMRPKAK